MNLTDEGIAIGIKKFSDSTNLMKILTRDNGISVSYTHLTLPTILRV